MLTLICFKVQLVLSKKIELEFLHITKTGGTSIEEFGKSLGFQWGFHNRDHLRPFFRETLAEGNLECASAEWHWPKQVFKRNPYSKCKDFGEDCVKKTFTVVRNPYARIVSEYKWEVAYYRDMRRSGKSSSESRQFWEDISKLHLNPERLEEPLSLNSYLQHKLRKVTETEKKMITHSLVNTDASFLSSRNLKSKRKTFCSHYRRQCEYVFPLCKAWPKLKVIDHILTFENLETDLMQLLNQYELLELPNGRQLTKVKENLKLVKLNKSNQKLNASHLQNETKRLIIEYYEDDFRLFNYSTVLTA